MLRFLPRRCFPAVLILEIVAILVGCSLAADRHTSECDLSADESKDCAASFRRAQQQWTSQAPYNDPRRFTYPLSGGRNTPRSSPYQYPMAEPSNFPQNAWGRQPSSFEPPLAAATASMNVPGFSWPNSIRAEASFVPRSNLLGHTGRSDTTSSIDGISQSAQQRYGTTVAQVQSVEYGVADLYRSRPVESLGRVGTDSINDRGAADASAMRGYPSNSMATFSAGSFPGFAGLSGPSSQSDRAASIGRSADGTSHTTGRGFQIGNSATDMRRGPAVSQIEGMARTIDSSDANFGLRDSSDWAPLAGSTIATQTNVAQENQLQSMIVSSVFEGARQWQPRQSEPSILFSQNRVSAGVKQGSPSMSTPGQTVQPPGSSTQATAGANLLDSIQAGSSVSDEQSRNVVLPRYNQPTIESQRLPMHPPISALPVSEFSTLHLPQQFVPVLEKQPPVPSEAQRAPEGSPVPAPQVSENSDAVQQPQNEEQGSKALPQVILGQQQQQHLTDQIAETPTASMGPILPAPPTSEMNWGTEGSRASSTGQLQRNQDAGQPARVPAVVSGVVGNAENAEVVRLQHREQIKDSVSAEQEQRDQPSGSTTFSFQNADRPTAATQEFSVLQEMTNVSSERSEQQAEAQLDQWAPHFDHGGDTSIGSEFTPWRPEATASNRFDPLPKVYGERPEEIDVSPFISARENGLTGINIADLWIPLDRDSGGGARYIAAGEPKLTAGEPTLTAGEPKLTAGEPKLTAGEPKLTAGVPKLTAGEPKLTAGVPEPPIQLPGSTPFTLEAAAVDSELLTQLLQSPSEAGEGDTVASTEISAVLGPSSETLAKAIVAEEVLGSNYEIPRSTNIAAGQGTAMENEESAELPPPFAGSMSSWYEHWEALQNAQETSSGEEFQLGDEVKRNEAVSSESFVPSGSFLAIEDFSESAPAAALALEEVLPRLDGIPGNREYSVKASAQARRVDEEEVEPPSPATLAVIKQFSDDNEESLYESDEADEWQSHNIGRSGERQSVKIEQVGRRRYNRIPAAYPPQGQQRVSIRGGADSLRLRPGTNSTTTSTTTSTPSAVNAEDSQPTSPGVGVSLEEEYESSGLIPAAVVARVPSDDSTTSAQAPPLESTSITTAAVAAAQSDVSSDPASLIEMPLRYPTLGDGGTLTPAKDVYAYCYPFDKEEMQTRCAAAKERLNVTGIYIPMMMEIQRPHERAWYTHIRRLQMDTDLDIVGTAYEQPNWKLIVEILSQNKGLFAGVLLEWIGPDACISQISIPTQRQLDNIRKFTTKNIVRYFFRDQNYEACNTTHPALINYMDNDGINWGFRYPRFVHPTFACFGGQEGLCYKAFNHNPKEACDASRQRFAFNPYEGAGGRMLHLFNETCGGLPPHDLYGVL